LVLGQDDAESTAAPAHDDASSPEPIRATIPTAVAEADEETLEFDNGYGGFVDAGRAYCIELDEERPTPAPWTNVMANPDFGSIVTAEGGGYTWSTNSQQNPLTPWPNDPVSDMPHEIIYLRDTDNGELWSATALHHNPWQRLVTLLQRRPWHRTGADPVRADERPVEALAAAPVQSNRTHAAPFHHRLCRVGAGPKRQHTGPVRGHHAR
jgi:hypothetical protein